ncbi:MAG: hypothetical protein ABW215_05480 [Kibdelosporangium sp.]
MLPEPERGIDVKVVHSTPDPEQLKDILGRRIRVAEVLAVERGADAHRKVQAGGFRGKVVLTF